MSLFTPDSFHYGESQFPWGGLLEPKLYQRFKWLLVISKIIGKIPVISMCPSNTISMSGAECFSGCPSSELSLVPQGLVSVDVTLPLSGVECFVGTFSIASVASFSPAVCASLPDSAVSMVSQGIAPVVVPCVKSKIGMNMIVSNSISMR
jgi:hypothetical protein